MSVKMSREIALIIAFVLSCALPCAAQTSATKLAAFRYAVVPNQLFSNGKVDPYGLGKRLRQRLATDPSWVLLNDVEVTPKVVAFSWPQELPWQTISKSSAIADDKSRLAQTALLSIATPGGRGKIEVSVVVSDIFGNQVGRFDGISGVFGSPGARMLNALNKAIVLLQIARPEFVAPKPIERVQVDESEVKGYLATALSLAPVEGIWSDAEGNFRIAIKREQESQSFIAIVLSSKHPYWDSGMVKGRFEPSSDSHALIAHYRTDDYQEQQIRFRIEQDSLVSEGGLSARFMRVDSAGVPTAPTAPSSPPAASIPRPSGNELRRVATGTGFAVAPDLIATNYHVVDAGTAWQVRFPHANDPLPLELVIADKANDLALMRVKGAPSLKPLNIVASRTARLGEDVYSVGFPLTGLLSDGHKVTTGVISGLAGLENDPRFFQLTVPTQPGNSGGPVFNSKGEVVGILASTLSVSYLYKETRTIPQNVNFAVKSDYLSLIISQADSGIGQKPVSLGVSRVDQIANAQESIGLISTLATEEPNSKPLDTSQQRSRDPAADARIPSLE